MELSAKSLKKVFLPIQYTQYFTKRILYGELIFVIQSTRIPKKKGRLSEAAGLGIGVINSNVVFINYLYLHVGPCQIETLISTVVYPY